MHIVGPAMWWIPDWLDRRLPHLNIERPEIHEEPVPADGRPAERETEPVTSG
jgi:RND superfamily putative drug exporter